jgi:glycosyltransferase involved in cell wall biosynthesis
MRIAHKRSKPRLLYVENSFRSFLISRIGVAQAASARGFDVHVAVPLAEAGKASLDGGVEWHDLTIARNLSPLGEARTMGQIVALYRRLRPDLLHHMRTKAIVYGSLAARNLGLGPVINTLTGLGHVFHTDSLRARLLRPCVTWGLRQACHHANQRLIVQNTDDYEACLRWKICAKDRLVLIKGSGVDLNKYRPLPEPEGKILVILPARMLWDKGVREFVEAAAQLRASGLPARFALVGGLDPDSPAALSADCLKAWEQSGAVEWWGWRDDLHEVIAQSHIVCLPSYGEGAPRVLMEAAACGRAIVTTKVAGCRDVVSDGNNGLLVPSGDARRLADALRRLIAKPELRSKLARNGPEMMENNFSLKTVIARNIAIYEELLRPVQGTPVLGYAKEQDVEAARDGIALRSAHAPDPIVSSAYERARRTVRSNDIRLELALHRGAKHYGAGTGV